MTETMGADPYKLLGLSPSVHLLAKPGNHLFNTTSEVILYEK